MFHHRTGPRAAHREREARRVQSSATLAASFPRLKSLTANLVYYGAEGVKKGAELKYMVNIANAKAVFRFNCPNSECIRGDFDLTECLANAVAKHQTAVTGELICQGTTINRVRCLNILRYALKLGYRARS
jgi:Cdc6-like AAA superfamily ATPase